MTIAVALMPALTSPPRTSGPERWRSAERHAYAATNERSSTRWSTHGRGTGCATGHGRREPAGPAASTAHRRWRETTPARTPHWLGRPTATGSAAAADRPRHPTVAPSELLPGSPATGSSSKKSTSPSNWNVIIQSMSCRRARWRPPRPSGVAPEAGGRRHRCPLESSLER